MTGSERRTKIFDLYSKNWGMIRHLYPWHSQYSPEFDEAIFCPLCLSLYNRVGLNDEVDSPLTLEHVPPGELGGKPVILTCKDCNNKSGTRIDSALIEFLKVKPFLDGKVGSSIRVPKATLNYEGGKIVTSAKLTLRDTNKFEFLFNINKGEHRHNQFEQLHTKQGHSLDFKFHSPSIKFVQIALLRIAYLKLFQKFGHGFILTNVYNGVRQQIINPESNTLDGFGVMKPDTTNAPEGIYINRQPENLKAFIVVFDIINNGVKEKQLVFVPSPFSDSIQFYREWNEMIEGITFNLGERFLDLEYLTDLKHSQSWVHAFMKTS